MFKIKKGFTLFELLVVVIIISLVYMLLIPALKKKKQPVFHFRDLKTYLQSYDKNGTVTLLCLNECKKCFIFAKGKKQESDIIKGELDSYVYKDGHLEDALFYDPKHIDTYENICFKYRVDSKKDTGDEIFVKYREKVYYFSPYFGKTKVFKDTAEATNYYTDTLEKLKD